MNTEHGVHRTPCERRLVRLVDHLHNHRNRRQFAEAVGAGQQAIPKTRLATFELLGLGAKHQVREVHVPRMRRHVRTLGHVADVAQIALVDDFFVIGLGDAIDLAGLAFVDQVEKRRKRVAQAHAATASVTDVEDPFEFLVDGLAIVVPGVVPVDGVPCRRLETAFA